MPRQPLRAALRLLMLALLGLVYRVRARGLGHIPARGGAVLVANHVTFIDALLLSRLTPRPVRFVMDHRYYDHWALGWFCRLFGAIPIASRREDPARLAAAYDAIDGALAAGELVAIFPEGRLTRDGAVGEFRPGLLKILARRPVPVVPVGLRGLWGSRFSRAGRRQGPWRRPVSVAVRAPQRPEAVALPALRAEVLRALAS
ncbi:MAG: 1-acyl-sn-glycerol-3-phosphate acyltransferase [Myxococcales bacterium]|nr:1-acyl-sn-glycerol-3-phosphate acyltransferase [Myxococcales bacterium]MCB9523195.1 1-acyl-sn-glycerol-3-phosphate acyltransferase [Myxococcales bacterium]